MINLFKTTRNFFLLLYYQTGGHVIYIHLFLSKISMSNILLGRKMKNETVLLCKKKKFPLFGKKNEKQQFIIKIYNKCDVYSPSRVLNFAITNEN